MRIQVNYLLDHLYRSCRISQRQTTCRTQACIFDPSIESHVALWNGIFPEGAIVNDENVSSARYLTFPRAPLHLATL
jgi:hypothetical protein